MENKSVFEMILSGEIDSDIIYEDKQIFAIHDKKKDALITNRWIQKNFKRTEQHFKRICDPKSKECLSWFSRFHDNKT